MIAKELIAAAAAHTGRHLVLSYDAGCLVCTCQEPLPGPDSDEQLTVRARIVDPGPLTVSELEMLPAALPLVQDALRQLGLYESVVTHATEA